MQQIEAFNKEVKSLIDQEDLTYVLYCVDGTTPYLLFENEEENPVAYAQLDYYYDEKNHKVWFWKQGDSRMLVEILLEGEQIESREHFNQIIGAYKKAHDGAAPEFDGLGLS
jgi:hypothetical protein